MKNESLVSRRATADQLALFAGGGLVSHELVSADDATRARLAAHETNTDLYNLTGVPTPEQKAIAEHGRQSSGYQEVRAIVAETSLASAPDARHAAAMQAAREARAARASQTTSTSLAKQDRIKR